MLAPSCLTSLDRRKTNTKHTVESRRKIKTSVALLYQEHSLTLDMCKDHCTVAGLWYSTLPGLWFLSPLHQSFLFTTSVVMLERKWAVLKSLSKRSVWLISHTTMRYLATFISFPPPTFPSFLPYFPPFFLLSFLHSFFPSFPLNIL